MMNKKDKGEEEKPLPRRTEIDALSCLRGLDHVRVKLFFTTVFTILSLYKPASPASTYQTDGLTG